MFESLKDTFVQQLRELVVDPEVDRRIDQIPNRLSESGYDAWGLNPEWTKWSISLVRWLYEKYFRVEVFGIEHVPQGRVLLVANHSGQLPLDGMMIGLAMALEADPPRAIRAMVEKWFPTLPLISTFFHRNGQVVGTPRNCIKLLENDEAVLVFPEGVGGSGKLIWKKYQLQRFGYGFMRLALRAGTPIVPIAVVGSEETYPGLYNIKPYFPITPTWPWLGPLGLIPLPTKIRLYFDEPIIFEGNPDDPDEMLQPKVEIVRSSIQKMIQFGLETRPSVFS
ncbi:lysophospholipid acyltransferase family protein [candidate division CSSED10-310 bacterium]|uniref:Lysophospholipid acyltransferase family protein n=1 Tax=candidate division CSSED10-310 bacterium TaxID=2855610 RepID=A0ABV6YT99_UNCC1